jgi:hypothetical protein
MVDADSAASDVGYIIFIIVFCLALCVLAQIAQIVNGCKCLFISLFTGLTACKACFGFCDCDKDRDGDAIGGDLGEYEIVCPYICTG